MHVEIVNNEMQLLRVSVKPSSSQHMARAFYILLRATKHRSVGSLTFMVLPCLPRETQVAGKIPETQEGGYSSDTLEYF